jgi:hypothetical protein
LPQGIISQIFSIKFITPTVITLKNFTPKHKQFPNGQMKLSTASAGLGPESLGRHNFWTPEGHPILSSRINHPRPSFVDLARTCFLSHPRPGFRRRSKGRQPQRISHTTVYRQSFYFRIKSIPKCYKFPGMKYLSISPDIVKKFQTQIPCN